jgi:hypothetical protein
VGTRASAAAFAAAHDKAIASGRERNDDIRSAAQVLTKRKLKQAKIEV